MTLRRRITWRWWQIRHWREQRRLAAVMPPDPVTVARIFRVPLRFVATDAALRAAGVKR